MTLEVNVAIPFLLELYGDYASEHLSKVDLLTILRWTESYIIRRLVCDLPTNALNKIFLAFGRSLSKDQYVESVAARYHLLTGTGRFPNDEEFKRDFEIRDFYNISKRRNYLLNKLTNFGTNEPVIIDALTIEHIMPQNENLSAEWRNDLGHGWKRVQETYLHTIGNLTLTGYNSNLSDKPFTSKRDMPGGFRESPISLSSDLRDLDMWNEDTILKRARRLAERAVTIWPSPTISGDRLAKYRDQKAKNGEAISIEHHFPKPTPIKDLWLSLQQRILNLDPGVTEEILKSYIAYKADTNFVDISVQKTRLILTLNLPFDHLDDPQEWCRDVSTIGKWGNGDAQFYLKPGDNLEYAMDLIGQALQFRSGDESGFVTA
jgi:predicted transport protein